MRRAYLIRHGKAGDRDAFIGDDHDRPLTKAGATQAELLAQVLAGSTAPPRRIFSSPARRCRATVAPYAERAALELELVDWLDEGKDALKAVRRLCEIEAEVVAACTHGDVIWGVLEWLALGGVDLGGRPDAPKASIWVLDWPDSSPEGVPVRASFLPPPVHEAASLRLSHHE
ncbi:MAG: SixA phosphatase family protein [Acidimicrobiales bacterium]